MPRSRRRSSWGSVYRRGRDTWLLRWWEDTPDGHVRRCETVHGTRFEADERLAQIRVSTRKGVAPSVSFFWDRYYRHDVDKLRPNTQSLYRSAWSKLEPKLGNVPVGALTPMAIQEVLDTMGGHSANVAKGVLKRVLDYAVMLGVIQSNPATAPLKMPESREYGKGIYTRGQIDRLLEVVRGRDLEAAFILQGCGGLRVGESIGVLAEDVAGHDGYATVAVRAQISKDGDVCELKTDGSKRTALVLEPYASRLVELAQGDHPGGWLTGNGYGGPCSRWALNRRWEWAKKRLPDDMERIPMRNLRSSYETWMHWEAGLPIDVVSKLMGHKDVKVTLEHYDRPGDEAVIAKAVGMLDI